MTKLDDGHGNLVGGYLWSERRSWPSWRTFWLWVRQGCPRKFPVIIEEGTITARATGRNPDGNPEIDAADITISNWGFDMALLPAGSLATDELIHGLLERRPATVIYPDRTTEQRLLMYTPR